ncbi:MAG: NnrS family protein, partial [Devosiaceae bacterium]|nr:NnrS family protein [Devosiaceae bacterium]
MAQSAQKRREFTGPALYSHGFRSFFLYAGTWGVLSMSLWIGFLALGLEIPSRMAGVDWHMHEMVFGYSSAVIAGFLLTAVPNWTGRLPIIGWPTAVLSGLWVLGRVAVFFSEYLPDFGAAMIDSSFLLVLALVIGREVIAGKNWRNLKILIIIGALAGANILFHIEAINGSAYQGLGVRFGVGLIILLITIIGGRVVPSFTRNWLVKQGKTTLPLPRNKVDNLVEFSTAIALVTWIFIPETRGLWAGYLIVGGLHLVRLCRWVGCETFGEPMCAI